MHEPSLLPAAPADWQLVAAEGPGPFITRAVYRRPDGVEVEWTLLGQRKGQGLRLLNVPTVCSPLGGAWAGQRAATDVVDLGPVRHRLPLLRAGGSPGVPRPWCGPSRRE